MRMHPKRLLNGTQKVIAIGVKINTYMANHCTPPHPTYQSILFRPPLLQLTILGPYKIHFAP